MVRLVDPGHAHHIMSISAIHGIYLNNVTQSLEDHLVRVLSFKVRNVCCD